MHTGQVVSMTPQTTTVRIVSHSACSECHAAGLCGLSEYTEKAIEVPTSPSATYGVGDEVKVVLKASMGFKAVWLAYFLPLVVLLAVALGLIALASRASAPWHSTIWSCGCSGTGSGMNTFLRFNHKLLTKLI